MRNKSTVQPGEKTKWCSSCKTEKPFDQFSKNKSRPDGLQNYCKPCAYNSSRTSFLNNKDKNAEHHLRWHRNHKLKTDYGITLEEFDLMVFEQNNLCSICRGQMETPRVDCSLETREVRSLLCDDCLAGVESFRENAELLYRAVSYLDSFKQKDRLVSDPLAELDEEED